MENQLQMKVLDAITAIKFVDGNVKFTLIRMESITPGNISEVLSSNTSS